MNGIQTQQNYSTIKRGTSLLELYARFGIAQISIWDYHFCYKHHLAHSVWIAREFSDKFWSVCNLQLVSALMQLLNGIKKLAFVKTNHKRPSKFEELKDKLIKEVQNVSLE